jgi:hypothetical protein
MGRFKRGFEALDPSALIAVLDVRDLPQQLKVYPRVTPQGRPDAGGLPIRTCVPTLGVTPIAPIRRSLGITDTREKLGIYVRVGLLAIGTRGLPRPGSPDPAG